MMFLRAGEVHLDTGACTLRIIRIARSRWISICGNR